LTPKKIIKVLAPFSILIIAGLFIYDIWSHGTIDHPGKVGYKANCANCHGENGEGIKSLVPPLNHSDFAAKNLDSIPCWLKGGLNRPITVDGKTYDQPMYPSTLDEVQISNIINFMNGEFFNLDKNVTPQWVGERLRACK
jgi:mono/diheme cytochrome c family protein